MSVKWISHRGESMDAPENTLYAFNLAMERGSDGMECDVHFTSDRVVVCSHDSNTARMAMGRDLILKETSFCDLKNLNVSGERSAYICTKIPALEEALNVLGRRDGKLFFIEIKTEDESIITEVARLVKNSGIPVEQIIIIAFSKDIIRKCAYMCPELKTLWLTGFEEKEGKWHPSADELIEILRELGTAGVDAQANENIIDKEYVKKLHDAGFYFSVWTVNDTEKAKRFVSYGVDAITSDCAALLRDRIEER